MPILTLSDARAALNMTGTADDAELLGYIEAVDDLIEAHIGPVTVKTYTQTLHGRDRFLLSRLPVVAVTSITGALTGALAYDVTRLTVNPDTGEVRRIDRGTFGSDLYQVTYTAGRGTAPPRVTQAARVLVQHLWRTQRGSGTSRPGAGDSGVDQFGAGFTMPNRVMELLTTVRIPGIA